MNFYDVIGYGKFFVCVCVCVFVYVYVCGEVFLIFLYVLENGVDEIDVRYFKCFVFCVCVMLCCVFVC